MSRNRRLYCLIESIKGPLNSPEKPALLVIIGVSALVVLAGLAFAREPSADRKRGGTRSRTPVNFLHARRDAYNIQRPD